MGGGGGGQEAEGSGCDVTAQQCQRLPQKGQRQQRGAVEWRETERKKLRAHPRGGRLNLKAHLIRFRTRSAPKPAAETPQNKKIKNMKLIGKVCHFTSSLLRQTRGRDSLSLAWTCVIFTCEQCLQNLSN